MAEQRVDFEFRERAFQRRMLTFAVVNRDHIEIAQFLNDAREYYINEITSVLNVQLSVKVGTCIHLTLEKIIVENDENAANSEENESESNPSNRPQRREVRELYIHTSSVIIQRGMDLNETFQEYVLNDIVCKFDEAIVQGSGFALSRINVLEVQINHHDPLRGSSFINH